MIDRWFGDNILCLQVREWFSDTEGNIYFICGDHIHLYDMLLEEWRMQEVAQ